VLVKLESANPGLSVKDRAADLIIVEAEKAGLLKKGDTVIERTSGNMGSGLAIACLHRGYKLVIVMSAGNSIERRQMIGAFGAKIVLVPQVSGKPGEVTGADLKRVEEVTEALARKLKAFRADQFRNRSSVRAHELGTGPELWQQSGHAVDVFVSVVGSSGTFTGVARYLKHCNPGIRCLVAEPKNAALLAGKCSVPGRHKLQGLGYMEVPRLFDRSLVDGYLGVTDAAATRAARLLAREEGILAGYTSGANVAAALEVARKAKGPLTIATVICDTGLKYLSSDLYPDPVRSKKPRMKL
jgi:cysteine synthase